MKKNVIKRTLTIIALALCVAVNAVAYNMPTLKDEKGQIDVYLNLDGTEASPLNITDITADRIISDLKSVYGTEATTPLEDNIYIRWYTYDTSTGNIVKISDTVPTWFFGFGSDNNIYPLGDGSQNCNAKPSDNIYRWYSGRNPWNSDKSTLLPKSLNLYLSARKDWSSTTLNYQDNYEIICEVANTNVFGTITNYVSSKETENGFFQLRYVIHFGKDPNGFVGALKDSGKEKEISVKEKDNDAAITSFTQDDNTKNYTAGISLSKDAYALSGGVTYARWYVADASGKELSATISDNTITTTTGVTLTLPTSVTYQTPAKDATNSQYWFSSTAGTSAIDGVTVSGNYGALSGCRIVCVMSNDTPDTGNFKLSEDDKTVTEEPDWDLKYTINFSELPFVQPALADGGKEIHVYLDLQDTQTSPIYLKSLLSNSKYTKSNVNSDASGLITSLDDSYVRIYMLDKNNSLVSLSLDKNQQKINSGWGISFTYDSFSPLGSGSKASDAYSDNIYRYYKGKGVSSIPDAVFFADENSKVGFASDITPSKSGNTIVVEFADYSSTTDNAITDYKCAKDNDDGFYKLRYVLHFNDEFPATNIADEDTYKTSEASVILNSNAYKEGSKPFSVTSQSADNPSNLSSISIDLSAAEDAESLGINNGVKYARWYFVDSDGNAVSNQTGLILSFGSDATATGNTVTKNGSVDATMGSYVYSASSSTDAINITLGGNGDFTKLANYKLVCVMSTDGSGAVVDASDETKVTHEPDWDVKYVISFVEDNDGFLATNRVDESSYTKKSTVVALGANTDVFDYSETDGTGKLTVNLTNDANIKTAGLNKGVKYIRWFFVDADGNIVTPTDVTLAAASGVTLTSTTSYGSYFYSETTTTSALDGITVTGTKENLLKYRLACVLSADDTNINVSDNTVLHEPDWDLYYTIELLENVTLKHYKGYAERVNTTDLYDATQTNGNYNSLWDAPSAGNYQNVHEWDYNIYVEPGEEVTLDLPFGITPGENVQFNSLEPFGYLRWYDYNTDEKSDCLILATDTKLQTYPFGSIIYAANNSEIYYNKEARVTFKAPSSGWSGSDIACDVSRYIDGIENSSENCIFEPTLSIRYIFHVRPAADIANALKTALENSDYATPYEYKGYTTIGINPNKTSTANLRVDLHDVNDYYFYNYSLSNKVIGSETPTFGTNLIHATKIVWYAYDKSGKYYMKIGEHHASENGRMVSIGTANVSGSYTPFAGGDNQNITFGVGDVVYICGYATDGTNMCPVSEFIVRFLEEYPIAADEVSTKYPQRTLSWLDQNYKLVGHINFDEDSEGANYNAPTTPVDNKTKQPSKWYLRSYAYSYAALYDYSDYCDKDGKIKVSMSNYWGGLGCKHGEYGLFKTKGISGISNNDTKVLSPKSNSYWYGWYKTENEPFYDRTYALDGRYGYFLYVDASEEARPVCMTTFDGKLCAGSSVVISAAVASITNENTMPQLMFHLYGADYDDATGEYTKGSLIHSFATCDFSSVVDDMKQSTWYQVYGKVTLQRNTDVESYDAFIVEVDNYGANTRGNDFAIDDIRIYQRNANILATQDAPVCGDDENGTVTFKIPHEGIVAKYGSVEQWKSKKLRWRIVNSKGTVVKADYNRDGTIDDSDGEYGEVEIYRNTSTISGSLISDIKDANGNADEKEQARYQTINGELYYVLAQGVELPAGDTYYISVAMQTSSSLDGSDLEFGVWGSKDDKCTVYSDPFTIGKQGFSITTGNTSATTNLVVNCKDATKVMTETETVDANGKTTYTYTDGATLTANVTVADPINGGDVTLSNVLFDWYVGTNSEYASATGLSDDTKATKLDDALTAFRKVYATENSCEQTITDGYTATHKAVLDEYVKKGLLFLGCSTITITSLPAATMKQYFYIKPLVQDVEITYTDSEGKEKTQAITLCTDGQELSLGVKTNGPKLNIGFKDVTYPTSAGERVVRLGLNQHIDNAKGTDGKSLRLPVHDISSAGVKAGTGAGETAYFYISDSNDPTWSTQLKTSAVKAGTVENLDANYVYIKFNETLTDMSDVSTDLTFHEGYWYDVDFSVFDSGENASSNYCTGEVFFILKIVPEYVTWTAKADANYGSTNWNNDENWTRSKKDELYKTTGYDNNGYDGLAGLEKDADQIKSYVPMKFTKVTVPAMSNFRYAYLAKMETRDNGILKDGSMTNADNYAATDYIQYDIMVKMTADTEDENNSGTTPTETAYGCEKFYGNTCAQIYFKPEAELRQQQYLDYTTAWVEKELQSNKWYMLASPLQDTYAGDMYVPEQSGRQETEAFTAISFNTTDYSRNNAPIYQRSWDRSDESTMTMNDSGALKTKDANISYSDWSTATTTSLLESNWSHVYNDMSVKYYDAGTTTSGSAETNTTNTTSPRYGFSLRAGNENKSVGTTTDGNTVAMIRLPKADKTFDYYYANDKTNTSDTKAASVSKTGVWTDAEPVFDDANKAKTGYGKLLMDKNNNYKSETNEYGAITQTLTNATSTNGLYLVSNPYMKTLNMLKFFNLNPNLEKKFWVIRGGVVYASTEIEQDQQSADGTTATDTYMEPIRPMESFFVKVASGKSPTDVTFNTNITTSTSYVYEIEEKGETSVSSGSSETKTSNGTAGIRYKSRSGMTVVPQTALSMTAANTAGKSRASVVVRNDADADFVDSEDVETLYDSNLTDVPTLYTVAGTEAVSINALPEIEMLPVGIVSGRSENATVTITGAETFDRNMWLYDAVDGKSVQLSDTTAVTMVANAHGRYFITSTLPSILDEEDASSIRCYSPQPGVLVVSSPQSRLVQVDVYGIDGAAIKRVTTGDVNSVTISVPRNVYIIKAKSASDNATVKMRVN